MKIFQEERISNKDAAEKVRNRENFVASHTYGEDIGDLGIMYVAYSYGEQHPLYVFIKTSKESEDGVWYYNQDDYILPNGKANRWTKKHLEDLKPNNEIQGRPNSILKKLIDDFKSKHGIGDNSHSDLEPGEK